MTWCGLGEPPAGGWGAGLAGAWTASWQQGLEGVSRDPGAAVSVSSSGVSGAGPGTGQQETRDLPWPARLLRARARLEDSPAWSPCLVCVGWVRVAALGILPR